MKVSSDYRLFKLLDATKLSIQNEILEEQAVYVTELLYYYCWNNIYGLELEHMTVGNKGHQI